MITPLDEVMVGVHVFFSLLALLGGCWCLVEVARKKPIDIPMVKILSLAIAVTVWLSWITGGWWYVVYYPVDRELIRAGIMKYGHTIVMENKEHIFYIGLLIATALPIYVYRLSSKLAAGDVEAKRLVFALLLIIVVGGIIMEMSGGLIAIAAKYSWMMRAGGG